MKMAVKNKTDSHPSMGTAVFKKTNQKNQTNPEMSNKIINKLDTKQIHLRLLCFFGGGVIKLHNVSNLKTIL